MAIDGIALTPSLFLTDRDEGDADTIRSGGRAFVSSEARAVEVMTELGLGEAAQLRALACASGCLSNSVQVERGPTT